MNALRAYTPEEVRAMVLSHIRELSRYWATLPEPKTVRERCDGLAFSILVMFDGGSLGLPALNVSLSPHPDDEAYHKDHGENWFEDGMVINDCQLHELFYAAAPEGEKEGERGE